MCEGTSKQTPGATLYIITLNEYSLENRCAPVRLYFKYRDSTRRTFGHSNSNVINVFDLACSQITLMSRV